MIMNEETAIMIGEGMIMIDMITVLDEILTKTGMKTEKIMIITETVADMIITKRVQLPTEFLG